VEATWSKSCRKKKYSEEASCKKRGYKGKDTFKISSAEPKEIRGRVQQTIKHQQQTTQITTATTTTQQQHQRNDQDCSQGNGLGPRPRRRITHSVRLGGESRAEQREEGKKRCKLYSHFHIHE
jgi:hypothetical protein